MKKLILTIAPDGEPTIKTEGFAGASCKDASKWLEAALGEVTSETLTPEYHQAAQTRPQLKQGT